MKFFRNNSIFFKKKQDGLFYILEKNKKVIRKLNTVASFLWENLENPISKEELVILTLSEFDVDEKQATSDIDLFINEYVSEGYVLEDKD